MTFHDHLSYEEFLHDDMRRMTLARHLTSVLRKFQRESQSSDPERFVKLDRELVLLTGMHSRRPVRMNRFFDPERNYGQHAG
jgi:hypothetical protein